MVSKEEALQQYGLSNKEIKVYLANLVMGSATVNTISKKADIHRTTTYDVLKQLMEKGLASSVIKDKTNYFEVADPLKLVAILDEKKQKLNSVMVELETLKQSVVEKPKVEFYEGKEGIKTVMEDILKQKNELLVFSSTKDLSNVLRFYFPHFINRRVKKNISAKVLTEQTKETISLKKRDKKELRETRFLPRGIKLPTATYIYGKKTAMFSLEGEPIAVLIENSQITKTQKISFNLMWNLAKE
ncbi:hypothetical protein GF361_00105 [Candidatus Woesearchaeota archaeon]|nr:hypothetical protein [Candidatus Woesearchaeota archaeon]